MRKIENYALRHLERAERRQMVKEVLALIICVVIFALVIFLAFDLGPAPGVITVDDRGAELKRFYREALR